ncbi:hypothetical protein EV138_3911 [Kribbella voronezhensis]|uniref:Uncharacterized protein n=1 Tax=Kribbella voronezhensis TaxID=2512212 RepID=A0A4R7TDZ1_9ACTN|nr:hypothetical protein [Kribbella voronezhensis]TDU90325.1 hypothetical protein EV138_3911 [Kribbella voronezhensis]
MKDLQELGAELHRLADDDPLDPIDSAALLERGRRGRKRRRAASIGGVVAGVAVIAAAAAYLPDLGTTSGRPGVAGTSPSPTLEKTKIVKVQKDYQRNVDASGRTVDNPKFDQAALLEACAAKLNDRAHRDPAKASRPSAVDLTGWRVMARSIQPKIGTALVAVSPSNKQVAYCDLYVSTVPSGLGASSYTRVGTVTAAPGKMDPNLMGQGSTCAAGTPCKGMMFLDGSRLPVRAVRLEIDAKNGHKISVPVNDGYFALIWAAGPNALFPAAYRAYDAAGKALPQDQPALGPTRIP